MQKINRKWIAMILVISLLTSFPAYAVEADIDHPETNLAGMTDIAAPVETEAVRVSEVESLRETNSETYLMSDGTYQCVVYAEDKYYLDSNDTLQRIDNTIVLETASAEASLNAASVARYKNTANAFDVRFSGSGVPEISMAKDGGSVTFSPLTAAKGNTLQMNAVATPITVGAVNDCAALGQLTPTGSNTVTYKNAFANTDLVYVLENGALKEYIILRNSNAAGEFSFLFTLDGLTLETVDDNAYLTDSDGNAVFALSDLFAIDANGVLTEALSYSFTPVRGDDQIIVTVTLDESYLQATDRTFPVIIDPSIIISSVQTIDACVCSYYPTTNYRTANQLRTGKDTDYGIRRSYIKFSIPSSITKNSVTGATLKVEKVSGVAPTCRAYRVTGSWDSATINWNNKAAYTTANQSSISSVQSGSAWYAMDVKNIVAGWVNGTFSNFGFVLVDVTETNTDHWTTLYSSDANSPHKPELHINYNAAPQTILLDDRISVSITNTGETKRFVFTPTATDFYTIESYNNNGDPCATLYNSNLEELESNDDGAGNKNFRITYHLIAGYEYTIAAGCNYNNVGTYTLRLYATTSSVSRLTTAISTDAEKMVTTSTPLEATYYKFSPAITGEYLFYTGDAGDDPQLYLYNASYALINSNDDGAGELNSRVVATLSAGQTYYLVATQHATKTGTYDLNVRMAPNIPTDSYSLRNKGTALFVDIHGPNAQEWVHQWSYSRGAQSRWTITKQSDGYYTIRSKYGNQYYVGVSETTTGTNNIKLYASISDNTRWKIYAKSSGELFIEPKTAPGKVLYSPNNTEGTELRLAWMGANVSNRNIWKIELQSGTPLEGQQWSKWCWATSARMFANHYAAVPNDRTQSAAVQAVKNQAVNVGGTNTEARKAANFYNTGKISDNSLSLAAADNVRYSEALVRRFLNDGHVIYISRGEYNEDNERDGGHAYVIVGYTTVYSNGALRYNYILYDPWPKNVPNPWDSPRVTIGQNYIRSYQWICNGRKSNTYSDNKIWDGIVVVTTTYAANTLDSDWN